MNENGWNIVDIFSMIWKWWWIFALTFAIGATGMYVYSRYFVDKEYTASGKFYITSSTDISSDMTLAMLNANTRFSETYIELAKSDTVLSQVEQKLVQQGYHNYDVAQLRRMVSYAARNETEVLEVTVTDTDPYMAQAVANAILDVAPDEIKRIVKAGAAEVVDTAKLPTSPSSPNVLKNMVIGAFLGLLLGCAIIFCIEFFDTRIKTGANLEELYGLPVIGVIPEISK